ncbi:ABC transporter permease [Solicola gregarius]|uniref:ABC transporter permease n=1 Tax=Solicola gregarius TaxID=2908642 RepID=A0AA46YJX1_9ACTN|nr:ABC transporter permease [Solicola gregarius]UYM04812.1 ABC transporter permease [Solicola gregarius]
MAISPLGIDDSADQADADPEKDLSGEAIAGRSPFQLAMEQLRRDKVAVICLGIVIFFYIVAIFAPWLCDLFGVQVDPASTAERTESLEYDGYPAIGPPRHGFTWDHPLGIAPSVATDNLASWIYGCRTSVVVATVSAAAATSIGIVMGLLAGFARGGSATVLNWIIDFFLSLPFILVALATAPIIIMRFADQPELLDAASLIALVLILSIFGWMTLARLIRGEVLSLREREFIQAARVIGVPTRTILRRELLPNLVAPIVVYFSLMLPAFVAAEAGLAYLGIGVVGMPSWGQTINFGSGGGYFNTYPLYLWAPILGILVLVVALNLLGDAVRDAFDPKTRR